MFVKCLVLSACLLTYLRSQSSFLSRPEAATLFIRNPGDPNLTYLYLSHSYVSEYQWSAAKLRVRYILLYMDIATGIVLKLVSSYNYILYSRKLLKPALYDLS